MRWRPLMLAIVAGCAAEMEASVDAAVDGGADAAEVAPAEAAPAVAAPAVAAPAEVAAEVIAIALPAVAGDGRTIAIDRTESDPSCATSYQIDFVRVSDGRTMDQITARTESCDGDDPAEAATARRFHGDVNARLRDGAYRPLVALVSDPADGTTHVGAGLRLRHDADTGAVSIHRGATRLWHTRLAKMYEACDLARAGDDGDWFHPPDVALLADPGSGVVLLEYGERPDSCMCSPSLSYRAIQLRPWTAPADPP